MDLQGKRFCGSEDFEEKRQLALELLHGPSAENGLRIVPDDVRQRLPAFFFLKQRRRFRMCSHPQLSTGVLIWRCLTKKLGNCRAGSPRVRLNGIFENCYASHCPPFALSKGTGRNTGNSEESVRDAGVKSPPVLYSRQAFRLCASTVDHRIPFYLHPHTGRDLQVKKRESSRIPFRVLLGGA